MASGDLNRRILTARDGKIVSLIARAPLASSGSKWRESHSKSRAATPTNVRADFAVYSRADR